MKFFVIDKKSSQIKKLTITKSFSDRCVCFFVPSDRTVKHVHVQSEMKNRITFP